uniref:Uncharacterized protein n=1 Tax=Alexandrium catenella TaxID=2925 RepID=A0A7S1WD82_ALECA|mmetsp:Transcript_51611/g.138082  ORF Transcript_51611/g.138082 Transcript_51611/m.138082 type:complete len:257 (+) Transcript_51611:1-771(+)
MWEEVEPAADAATFNSGLGAALTLCTVADSAEGFSWGGELWRWASQQGFELDGLKLTAYARMLETYQHCKEVDSMIAAGASAGEAWIDHVLMGALVDAAGGRGHWQRAEDLWLRLVRDYRVKPTILQYTLFSKARMLSGRVLEALQVYDEVGEDGLNTSFVSVQGRAQLLLLMSHSSPSQPNLRKLQRAFDRGEKTIRREGNRHVAGDWDKMKRAAQRLQTNAESVRLRDVLIGWKAKTRSVMKQWPNHAGGSQYL